MNYNSKTERSVILSTLADELPIIWEERSGLVEMSGEELKLTPYEDQVEIGKNYYVPVPEFHAVDHRKNLNRAFKESGMQGVKAYTKTVMDMYATANA